MSKLTEWSAENLERAAKHMRELDKSVNAKAAIELARREQDVELAREASRGKEFEAQRAASAGQVERVRWEEQRKTIDHKRESEKALADYKIQQQRQLAEEGDRLARKRDEDNRRRALEDERIKAGIRQKAEEDIQAERRRSDEHRARLERDNMKARALAEAEGRVKEQRDNEEVYTRQLRLRLAEERQTRLEAINAAFRNAGEGAANFLSDPRKIAAAAVSVAAVFLGVWGTREGVRLAGRLVEKRLGTPPLVRETSRLTSHFALRKRAARALGLAGGEPSSLADVVLRAEVGERVTRLVTAVKATRANAAPYRNLLFYGPPGTGKTMVAKRLARASGMDYAIMSGGDVGPLGRDAVTELHRLFDWAATSRRGLLLFIDEADAFLASRSRAAMSEEQRNALNALLYRTGENSRAFMLVLATNRPGDLDRAVTDRVDEAMVFDLPDAPARRRLVELYFDTYLRRAGADARTGPFGLLRRSAARISLSADVDNEGYLAQLAERTAGFSGREIAKLMISVQGAVYGRPGDATLTRALMDETVAWKLAEHADKARFAVDAAYDYVATGGGAGGASAAALRAAGGAVALGGARPAAPPAQLK